MSKPVFRKTILVAEDDTTMRELIGLHLQAAGYAVRAVRNGFEAAQACLSLIPDLILTDVYMPRMDGMEFVTLLRADPRLADVPVIFLTVDEGAYPQGKALGAAGFLTKPILVDKLLDTVKAVLAEAA